MSGEGRRSRRRSRTTPDVAVASAARSRGAWTVLLILLLLASVAIWHGAQTLRAALRNKALEQELRLLAQPEAVDRIPTPDRLAERFATMGALLSVQEAELRARLWWLTARQQLTPASRIGALREAQELLRQALARRPTSAYNWLLLAQIEYALEPRGTAGATALQAALDLGVRGLLLQRQLIELRLEAERFWSPALTARAQDALRVGIRDHGTDLAMWLRHGPQLSWVCADVLIVQRLGEWCAQRGYVPTPR